MIDVTTRVGIIESLCSETRKWKAALGDFDGNEWNKAAQRKAVIALVGYVSGFCKSSRLHGLMHDPAAWANEIADALKDFEFAWEEVLPDADIASSRFPISYDEIGIPNDVDYLASFLDAAVATVILPGQPLYVSVEQLLADRREAIAAHMHG